jgi:nucleoside-diphosphate-sugar epimerase
MANRLVMRVLITGVTGFLGVSLVEYFRQDSSIILYGCSRNTEEAKRKFKHTNVTLIETPDTEKLNELKIDVIIHLAGIAHDLSGNFQPSDYYKVNFEGTKKIYQNFLSSSTSKFIFLSSIKAAIDSSPVAVDETIAPNPTSDYGKSKLLAEQFIHAQQLDSTKTFYILRPCMIHGPGNKGNLNVLYKFVKKGIPFPFAAFQNERSFLSIDNFTMMVNQILRNKVPSGLYHLADSETLSTLSLYKLICHEVNQKERAWAIPKTLVKSIFFLLGKTAQLNKLKDNAIVNNTKILSAIHSKLPVRSEEGLVKTIQSFNG